MNYLSLYKAHFKIDINEKELYDMRFHSPNTLHFKIPIHNKESFLYLNNELDIKLLNGNKYSNKKGFIGGCISRIGNKIMVFGELEKIDPENKIRKFIQERNLEIIVC